MDKQVIERKFKQLHIDGKIYLVEKEPKPGCRRCFGRGYTGRDTQTKEIVPCRCVGKFI